MSGLDDQAEVGRERTTVAGACGLLIGVRSGQVVGKLSRALEHLSVIVRSVGVFNFLSQNPCLVGGMRHANQVAPGNAVERVTSSANLAVDQEASTDARQTLCQYGMDIAERLVVNAEIPGMVKAIEQTFVWPWVRSGVEAVVSQ
jgi:hypothetical protein